jgi:hypothetical protein
MLHRSDLAGRRIDAARARQLAAGDVSIHGRRRWPYERSGSGNVKIASDRCPACCKAADGAGQNGHVDDYNDTTQACTLNSVGDLGIYFSVKLID